MIYVQRMKINDIEQTQCAHDAMVTSLLHKNNVTALFWRYNDVVNTSRVLWEELIIIFMKTWGRLSDHDFHNITLASPATDYKDERMNE